METQPIHDLIKQTYSLTKDTDSYVAQNLLCCVLEIFKHDGSSYIQGSNSGYFWEKMDKALKELGYEAIDNQHCIIKRK